MNDPTQFEQIAVSCSDRVGSLFTFSPCVSSATALYFEYHVSLFMIMSRIMRKIVCRHRQNKVSQ